MAVLPERPARSWVRRAGLLVLAAAVIVGGTPACSTPPPTPAEAAATTAGGRPLALVYRGPAGCRGCSAPVARMLRSSPQHFRVRFVGPEERLQLTPSALAGVSLYAQPGGDTSTKAAYRELGATARNAITEYVHNGGRYLGICQGAYLAGSDPGMGLLSPGDTGWYIATRGASTHSERDTVIPIRWGTSTYDMYFQDGAYMSASHVAGEQILARYTNGRIAALVRPVGAGRIGVVGPHPEAPRSWYRYADLDDSAMTVDRQLGYDLITHVMG